MSSDDVPTRLPSWADQLDDADFSWERAVGGWRGGVESILPGLVFVIMYIASRDLLWTCTASGTIALIALVVRLAQRQPVRQAFSGILGVVIGVIWAIASGKGENYFTWGLISAGAFLVFVIGSILVHRPLVSVGVSALWRLPAGWRGDPDYSTLLTRCTSLTWVWAGLFAVRLAVQYPLWSAGMIAELGIAKLILGLPLFALVCWVTWVGLRPFSAARADKTEIAKDA